MTTGVFEKIYGTVSNLFQVGPGGPQLKKIASDLLAITEDDGSTLAKIQGKAAENDNEFITKAQLEGGNGGNFSFKGDTHNKYLYGNITDYPVLANPLVNEVQYTRIRMRAGEELTHFETYIGKGDGTDKIRMALYDQVDPANTNSVPNDKLIETALTATPTTNNYFTIAISYTILATGYYWLAMVSDTPQEIAATAHEYEANLSFRREQTTSNGDLPATASGLSNPRSRILYIAALRTV